MDHNPQAPAQPPPKIYATIARLTGVAVACVAGYTSYEHIVAVALAGGEDSPGAYLYPIPVDGLIVAGSMAMIQQRRAGRRPSWAARGSVIVGVIATLAANMASADPTLFSRVVAAFPALSFIVIVEVLLRPGGAARVSSAEIEAQARVEGETQARAEAQAQALVEAQARVAAQAEAQAASALVAAAEAEMARMTAALAAAGAAVQLARREAAQAVPAQEPPKVRRAQRQPGQKLPAQRRDAQRRDAQRLPAQRLPAQREPARKLPAHGRGAQVRQAPAGEELYERYVRFVREHGVEPGGSEVSKWVDLALSGGRRKQAQWRERLAAEISAGKIERPPALPHTISDLVTNTAPPPSVPVIPRPRPAVARANGNVPELSQLPLTG